MKNYHECLSIYTEQVVKETVPVIASCTSITNGIAAVVYAQCDLQFSTCDATGKSAKKTAKNWVYYVVHWVLFPKQDMIVRLGSQPGHKDLQQPLRAIQEKCLEQNDSDAKAITNGAKRTDTMLMAADRLDLPAGVVTLIYRR